MALKDVRWMGGSRAVVRGFPKGARLKVGQELTRVQLGADPKHGKAMPEVGRGAQEIRVSDNKEAFRVIYVASIGTRIIVLHAFHKKSKQGIATPRSEVELARRRYRMLMGNPHG
jgi:phage-related protein